MSTIPMCRIRNLGDPDQWAFAIWQASSGRYTEAVLLSGKPAGHPPRHSTPPAPVTSEH